ncbi:choice-of-anchor D domain-containing protein [Pyxidicoccus trucidator]|uniref:choice-of-anchor D domain-containing protein n=1 Tax=Pyxidicoccus trucidator TaxID=2709662 RepID=UPI0013DACAEC|nr:choice-of-anchor D domain-containing protein [Pyxidicoccus trucidator]
MNEPRWVLTPLVLWAIAIVGCGSSTAPAKPSNPVVIAEPSNLVVTPETLEFGPTTVGATQVLKVRLSKQGQTPLTIEGASTTAPHMVVQPFEPFTLEGNAEHELEVRFTPDAEGAAQGELRLRTRSGPLGAEGEVRADVVVRLSGNGLVTRQEEKLPCQYALEPAEMDFGEVPVDEERTLDVVVRNIGTTPCVLRELRRNEDSDEAFHAEPVATTALEPRQQARLLVRFKPTAEDDFTGVAEGWMDLPGAGHLRVPLRGRGLRGKADRFIQHPEPKVDVLFVVDNSGSMMEEQKLLGANFRALSVQAASWGLDYHIAVTTTGLDPSPGGWSECPGGAAGGENGRLFPPDHSSPRIITPATPKAEAVFATNTNLGVCHWNEQGLDAMYRALSAPLASSEDDPSTPLPRDGNAGFLREDATLAVIFISDEEDFSSSPVRFYEDFLLGLKGGDRSKFSVSAIVAPLDLGTCPTASSPGSRYIQLAEATGGIVESICTPDWTASLRELSKSAFAPNRAFPLTGTPSDTSRITVRVDGGGVRSGWKFDPPTQAVIFDTPAAPPPASAVEVIYPTGG